MNAFTDRRTVLRGLGVITAGAAATVASFPAIAAAETPDPVFARIEALNAATAHLDEIRDTDDRCVRGGLPH
jgi:phosphoribosylcarboxyaminoimidazole (NCAIR) mutase